MRSANSHSWIATLLGLVLIVASGLKTYELATEPIPEVSLWTSRWFLIAVAEFELILGLWLLSPVYPKQAWTIALSTFGLYSSVALWKGTSGDSSCGCFGKVELSPWVVLVFDLVATGLLAFWPPPQAATFRYPAPRWRWGAAGALVLLLVAFPSAILVAGSIPATLSDDGDIVGDHAVVLLEPASWEGRPFPLLKHTDIGQQLRRGSWIILLYRPNCPSCREVIPQVVALAHELSRQAGAPRVALIEAPAGSETEPPAKPASVCARGRLISDKKWRFGAPLLVKTKDGVVTLTTDSTTFLEADLWQLSGKEGSLATPTPAKGVSFPDYRKARRDQFMNEIACGPLSLISVLQHLGVALTEDDTDKLIAAAGVHGVDMLQLKDLVQGYGLHALGVQTSPEKLRQMGHAAIVHVEDIGFAAVLGYTGDGFRIVYPMKKPGILPNDLFEKTFGKTGHALLDLPKAALGREPGA